MGDVKMLAMIGAFLGWQAVLLTLLMASLLGSLAGVAIVAAGARRCALPAAFRLVPGRGGVRREPLSATS